MADFEKVYRIDFDTSKAVASIGQFESTLKNLEGRVAQTLRNPKLQAAAKSFGATSKRATAGLKSGLGSLTPAAQRLDAAMAAANKRIAAMGGRPAAAIDRTKQATKNLTSAGKTLDRLMTSAAKKAEAGQKRVDRAIEGTRKEIERTDRALTKAMRPKGERRKARSIRGIGNAAAFANQSVTGLALRLTALFGVAAGIREVTDEYIEFDRVTTVAAAKFSRLEPELAPGTEAFKRYQKEIRAAGLETEHAASGVARAVDFWAKADKNSEITKASIPTTLDFASANTDAAGSVLDVARAGDILSDVLGQFRMNSEDTETHMVNLARVSDVMSAAANKANFSADELFDSFKGSGPILKMVGSDIEETSALLAVMANAGIKGDRAGTQLKMSIANLSAPTGRQTAALERLGVTLKDSEGNFRGLTTIIGDLNKATQGMGTADRAAVFSDIVGRRALPAFINLLAEGQSSLDEMTAKLRDAGGETKRLAEVTRQSASAQIAKFKNKLTGLAFQVINETKLFEKLGASLSGVDWASASKWITDTLVPALLTAGDVFANTLWPAVKRAGEILEVAFAPALQLVEMLTGKMSESGNGLVEVLGWLGAAWVAYRVALVGVKGVGMIQYLIGLVTQIGTTTTATTALNTATAGTSSAMGTATKAAGVLNGALGVLAAGAAGWYIGTLIHDNIIEPLAKANAEAKRLSEEFRTAEARQRDPNVQASPSLTATDMQTGQRRLSEVKQGYKFTDEETAILSSKDNFSPEERVNLTRKQKKVRFEAFDKWQEVKDLEKFVDTLDNRLKGFADLKAMAPSEAGAQTDPYSAFQDFSAPGFDAPIEIPLPEATGGQSDFTQLVESQKDAYKLDKEKAVADREFQQKLLAAQGKSEGKAITQNIDMGTTNFEIHTSADPEEVARVVRREQDRRDRQGASEMRKAARAIGPSEF